MAIPTILLLDNKESVRTTLARVFEHNGFEVVAVANVNDALRLIGSQKFDVLVSDLHMPHAGDGFTVISAMRRFNPQGVTLIFSGYPETNEAAVILMQADETLVSPLSVDRLVETIKMRLKQGTTRATRSVESLANILEQGAQSTIQDWFLRIELEPNIITVKLDFKERCAHLSPLLCDIVNRLRYATPLGAWALPSRAAAEHGVTRHKQRYSAAMLAEESRILQLSIFQTLQNNLHKLDVSLLLVGVMAIADELDSHLSQALSSFINESRPSVLPVAA
jgi:CheY-like chemotaxis protein